jgi:membrane associated rhomboid family serine protease
MILPIAHENMTSRRWPLITIAFMAVCFVALSVVQSVTPSYARNVQQAALAAITYHRAHPYLEPCSFLAERSFGGPLRFIDGVVERASPEERATEEERRAEQRQLGELCDEVEAALARLPVRRFGYVPARGDVLGLLTHQFMHAGWLHLGFNMWFLWLCGCNMEDRWGRLVYGAIYLGSGVVAALAHKLFGASPDVPLVGASGAIAGAMGAFLVVFAKTRIRFVTFFFRPVLFSAPAYVMLPLWLASQLFYAAAGTKDGVAYWAHVGGFVFGAAAALALRLSGTEKKLDEAVDRTVTVSQDPRIVEAGELVTQGRADDAIAALERLYAEMPSSIDVQLELLRASKAIGDRVRETAAYGRLIQLYLRTGADDAAMSMFGEVAAEGRQGELPAPLLMQMAQLLEQRGRIRESAVAYQAVHERALESPMAVKAMFGHAKAAARLGQTDAARELFSAARESPFSTRELDDAIDAELAKL